MTAFPNENTSRHEVLKWICVEEQLGMKKYKLQCVDIFRTDFMIWGAMGRIFKIQTETNGGSFYVQKCPLVSLSSTNLFFLYPFLSSLLRGVSNPNWNMSDTHCVDTPCAFYFISLLTQKDCANGGTQAAQQAQQRSLSHSPKSRGSRASDYKHGLAFDGSARHLASALVILSLQSIFWMSLHLDFTSGKWA